MKFEEKLIKLRKENAWSQEEFAEKLGVTRQTISKWELGQTTPDTDNLAKMSKIFGVSVNDLLDNNVSPVKNNSQKKDNKTLKIIILVVVLIFVLLGIGLIVLNKIFNKVTNQIMPKSVVEMFQEYSIPEIFNGILNKIQNDSADLDKSSFNNKFKSMYLGNIEGALAQNLLTEIIQSNENNSSKIIVLKYKNVETSNSQEIQDIANKIDNGKLYNISYEYNEDGYISKAIITEKGFTKSAINLFNHTFKTLYFGSQNGFFVTSFIDEVIKSNEDHPDNLISVSYNGIVTSDKDKLKNMKKSFSNIETYDIYYEYDESGLITRANITK